MNNLYPALLQFEFIAAGFVFILLFFVSAPYGRFIRKGWGPSMPAKWAWFFQEFPAFAVILILFIYLEAWKNPFSIVFLLIWESHYFHRTFIYPFRFASGKKNYPILLVLFAIIFNVINGFVNGYFLFALSSYENSWLSDPRFIVGSILFYLGYGINKNSDRILRNLKLKSGGQYVLPSAGMFHYISSPHYFGEWLAWSGWALLTWSTPGLAFSVFTFANLAPRAWSHHQWYHKTFSDYPEERKAFFPGIW